jgi:hypothetical protein
MSKISNFYAKDNSENVKDPVTEVTKLILRNSTAPKQAKPLKIFLNTYAQLIFYKHFRSGGHLNLKSPVPAHLKTL